MKKLLFSALAAFAIAGIPVNADNHERMAKLTSDLHQPGTGQCTIEVVVPGAAQIKVEGNEAKLYHLSGREPEWKRFECTSIMPEKPEEFRMETVAGRRSPKLVHGPRHRGGSARIYINDSGGGEDTYTFNLIWSTVPDLSTESD